MAESAKQSNRDRELEIAAQKRGISPHLLAALKIAAGTTAYGAFARGALADIVRYDNAPHGQSGHFEWLLAPGSEPPPIVLDITKPAGEQSGIGELPGTFRQNYFVDHYSSVRLSAINFDIPYQFNNEVLSGYNDGGFADPLAAGTVIGPDQPFDPDFFNVATAIVYGYGGFSLSEIPEGLETYLGVRWYVGQHSNIYFGWIGVKRTENFLDAFAWGRETRPNTPIPAGAVPEPDAAAEIALGLLAMGYMTGRERRAWIRRKLTEISMKKAGKVAQDPD